MDFRDVRHAQHPIFTEIRFVGGAVPDIDLLIERDPHAEEQTSLELGDQIHRLDHCTGIERGPNLMDADFAGSRVHGNLGDDRQKAR